MEDTVPLVWIHARRRTGKNTESAVGEAGVALFASVPVGQPGEFKSPARWYTPERVHIDCW